MSTSDNANTFHNTPTLNYANDPHSFVFNNPYSNSYHFNFVMPPQFPPVHQSHILHSQMSASPNYQPSAPPAQMLAPQQYHNAVAPSQMPVWPNYQPHAPPSQLSATVAPDTLVMPSQISAPPNDQSPNLAPPDPNPRATTPPNEKAKVVLIMLLDHGTSWASPRHQHLIHQLTVNNYHVIASSPASAALSITRYDPSIILLYEANSLNKKCDRKVLKDRLQEFTNSGGILIFGGVPWAFNPVTNTKAKTVFNTAFRLNWTVGEEDLSMVVGDSSAMMQKSILTLNGTYLHNVALGSRVYRPYPHKQKDEKNKEEPCAVALQMVGDGCMGYIGSKDLYSEESKFMLVDLLNGAEWLAKCKDGKTPAEVMTGGKLWKPPGWVVEQEPGAMDEDTVAQTAVPDDEG